MDTRLNDNPRMLLKRLCQAHANLVAATRDFEFGGAGLSTIAIRTACEEFDAAQGPVLKMLTNADESWLDSEMPPF